jgi:DNA-binding PadR family transcriptional regulator
MSIPKDLVAASATPIVLSILSRGDSYGYAIIEQVRLASGGEMQWADGMLYPILHRLENKSLVSSYEALADNGRKRKYYKLTRAGKRELTRLREQWDKLHDILVDLGGQQACFA